MDDAVKRKLSGILEEYSPEQRKAPDAKYGTVEKRIAAMLDQDPKEAEEKLIQEVEEQQAAVNRQASDMQGS